MSHDQGLPRSDAALILLGQISCSQAERVAPNLYLYLLHMPNVYASLHQASELGIRGLQGGSPPCQKSLAGYAEYVTILDPKVATQSGRIEGKSNCVLLTTM
jgi:hypothetical protein